MQCTTVISANNDREVYLLPAVSTTKTVRMMQPLFHQADRQVSVLLGCRLQPTRTRCRWAELLMPGLQGCLDMKHPAQHMRGG